jgi:glycosyltransferase involved in cell wall biosynthesis
MIGSDQAIHTTDGPVDDWSHLAPLKLSLPLDLPKRSYQCARNIFRRAMMNVQSHRLNIRNYYQAQRTDHGTLEAAKNTGYEIVKGSYHLLIEQHYFKRAFGAVRLGHKSGKNNLRFPVAGRSSPQTRTTEDLVVSVVIPTKNAGADLRPLLLMLKNQEGFKRIEIVIVDSGSTDETLKIGREFATSIIEIPPAEFSHSYARNVGAEKSTGDYVLFMVQDSLPPCVNWLRQLYQPVPCYGVIASSCSESPRRNSDLFYRTQCWNHQSFFNPQNNDIVLQKPNRNDYRSLRANANVSNIACLIGRDVFLKYKFRGDYAEDIDLGLRLIRDGHRIALLTSTRIIHSHNRSAYYHLKRGYVDGLFMLEVFPDYEAQVIEATRLMEDILLVYQSLHVFLTQNLGPSVKSFSMATLSGSVMDGLLVAASRRSPSPITLQHNPNVDPEFQAFIDLVYRKNRKRNGNRSGANGALLSGFRLVVTRMLEYMQGIYDVCDEPLLNDFRESLFKAFAFNIGVRLATSVKRGSPATRSLLQELSIDLRDSI